MKWPASCQLLKKATNAPLNGFGRSSMTNCGSLQRDGWRAKRRARRSRPLPSFTKPICGWWTWIVLLDQSKYAAWRRGFQRYLRADEAMLDQYDKVEAEVTSRLQSFRVPTIELLRDTPA